MSQQSTYTDTETKLTTTSPAASPRTGHHSPGGPTLSNRAPQYPAYPQYYYASPHYVGQFQPSPEAAPSVGTSRPAPSIQTHQRGYSLMHGQAAQQYGCPPNQSTYSQPAHLQLSPSTHARRNLPRDQPLTVQSGETHESGYTQDLKNLLQKHKWPRPHYKMAQDNIDGHEWHATLLFAGENFVGSGDSKAKAREAAARLAFPRAFSILETPYKTRE